MKNAKDLCKKKNAEHYNLAMHTFGLLACISSLKDLDELDVGTAPLMSHFQEIIDQAPLDLTGEVNTYQAPNFVPCLAKHFLPHATLWSGLMLGDLGVMGQDQHTIN
ncbi:unnamed protein product [Pleuronectes platessa]|uniref:Uncharacterized protein n=1 Tax=Pleuronectes platessa TaxID=8262 RepID=A0A9N7UZK6_PLEPL|nr:unnamed protein product [Pleuronectes platessa]